MVKLSNKLSNGLRALGFPNRTHSLTAAMVLNPGNGLPPFIAQLLGEAAARAVVLSARQPVWRLPTKTPIVLRRSAQAITDPTQAAADLDWLHSFLEDLAGTLFLAPRPMPMPTQPVIPLMREGRLNSRMYVRGTVRALPAGQRESRDSGTTLGPSDNLPTSGSVRPSFSLAVRR